MGILGKDWEEHCDGITGSPVPGLALLPDEVCVCVRAAVVLY